LVFSLSLPWAHPGRHLGTHPGDGHAPAQSAVVRRSARLGTFGPVSTGTDRV